MPLEWFRKMAVDAADKTNMDFVGSKLIYSNWIDGIEHEGVKIEQDIHQWIYSEFLDSSSYIVKTADGKVQISDYDTAIKNNNKWILLDMLNNKIFINGRKLTSEDLHSQTATVDILKILISPKTIS